MTNKDTITLGESVHRDCCSDLTMSYDVVTTSYDVVDDFQNADIPSRRRCEIISYDIVDHYESVRFTSCDDFDDIVSTSYDVAISVS